MDARPRVRRTMVGLAVLVLLVSGCTSHASSAAPTSATHTDAANSTPDTTSTVRGSRASTTSGTHSTTSSTTSLSVLTGAPCTAAVGRVVAAAAKLIPAGTARKPTVLSTCLGYQLLNVEFAATKAQSWSVKIKVKPGTAADCHPLLSNGGRCSSVVGHPGFLVAEAMCGGIPCDQASVYGDGYLADVYSYPSTFDMRRQLPATPGSLVIGVAALKALTG